MRLTDAVVMRASTRAFRDDAVAVEAIREILELARRAPSGGNIQPWRVHVLAGRARRDVVNAALRQFDETPEGTATDHHPYPANLSEPYRGYRREVGLQLYEIVGVGRADRAKKLQYLRRNFEFFGAPVGMIFTIERQMEPLQWTDLGMFLQTIMLVAPERGLATCCQGVWSQFAPAVRAVIDIPEKEIIVCGMAIGYPDESARINALKSTRAAVDDFTVFHE